MNIWNARGEIVLLQGCECGGACVKVCTINFKLRANPIKFNWKLWLTWENLVCHMSRTACHVSRSPTLQESDRINLHPYDLNIPFNTSFHGVLHILRRLFRRKMIFRRFSLGNNFHPVVSDGVGGKFQTLRVFLLFFRSLGNFRICLTDTGTD